MSDFNVLEEAIIIASQSHYGQKDKAGRPYILHCFEVMNNLPKDSDDELKAAAILHDTLEDTVLLEQDLLDRGIPPRVVGVVQKLTKKTGEDKKEYRKRVLSSRESCLVKMADLRHNMDLSRLPMVTEKDLKRYKVYQEFLNEIVEALEIKFK